MITVVPYKFQGLTSDEFNNITFEFLTFRGRRLYRATFQDKVQMSGVDFLVRNKYDSKVEKVLIHVQQLRTTMNNFANRIQDLQ